MVAHLPKENPPTSGNSQESLFKALLQTAINTPRQQITRRLEDSPAPLSFAQQRLWFLEQLEPGNTAYNVFRAYRLTGQLNLIVLEQCLNEIVCRHDSLRTNFTSVDGHPTQVILSHLPLSLPVINLSDLPEATREAQTKQHITQERQRIFDLRQGPLIKATLLQLAEGEHILLLVAHHLITDGWSMSVFFRELSTLYKAYLMGEPSPLVDPSIQYTDFAVWQREWLQGEVLETQLAYWKQQLAGYPPILNLPTDHPRPAMQTYPGASQSSVLTEELTTGLRSLSRKEGATIFMILLAAFQAMLYRYTTQDDIVVGTPIAGRTRAEIEGLIGLFINTLVLRTDLSGNPTFQELLGRVRETALGAYNHQELPFEKLVEELQPARDFSFPPLFQVMFNMHNFANSDLEMPGLTVEQLLPPELNAQFDLALNAVERNGGIHLKLIYNTDLFEAATVRRMLGHFKMLLEDIVENPNQRLSSLSLLAEDERHQLLVAWNETQRDFPKDLCIHELFEAQIEGTPEAVAVIFEDEQLTYRQLNLRANQLAHYLKKHGIGPETVVGICVERSLEMVVGLLAILKAGGAYVPLDPAYPAERLDFMIKDASMQLLITQKEFMKGHLPSHIEALYLDEKRNNIAQENTENPTVNTTSNNLAYVIYTSGSTGKPKGTMIPHKAIYNHMVWMQREFGYDESVRVLQKTPFSFDASVWEFYASLLSGGQLVMAQPEGHRDGEYLVKTIIQHEITTLQVVPSQLQLLLNSEGFENCHSLRQLFCGGEALPVELVNRFSNALPKAALINLYGPSEAAIDTTFWAYGRKGEWAKIPIGRPIVNAQIYILDSNCQPAPINVPGEAVYWWRRGRTRLSKSACLDSGEIHPKSLQY